MRLLKHPIPTLINWPPTPPGQAATLARTISRAPWISIAALLLVIGCTWLPVALLLAEAPTALHNAPHFDTRLLSLMGTSLVVAGGATALAVLIGVPIGLLLGRTELRGRGVIIAAQALPLLLPPFIAAIGWLHVLGKAGPVNSWLMSILHLDAPPIDPYTPGGVIWVLGLATFPIISLIVAEALGQVDPEIEEAALLTTTPWRVLWHVTLPQAKSAIIGAGMLAFMFSLSDFAVPSFFGVNVYTVEIFAQFGAFFDFGAGVISSLPLITLTLVAFWAHRRFIQRLPVASINVPTARRQPIRLRQWSWLASTFCVAPVIIAAIVPLLALVGKAPTTADYALAWKTASSEVGNSLFYALLGATGALIICLPVSWLASRTRLPLSRPAETIALGSLAVPGIVFGIGMIRFWNRGVPFIWVYHSLFIVVLAMMARAVPFATAALTASWRQFPETVIEMARLDGASRWRSARHVFLPLMRPGIVIAWCLAFVAAITELQATTLVYPPGCATLPVRIFTMQHDGQTEHVAALCLILMAITVVPVAAVWFLARLRGEEGQP